MDQSTWLLTLLSAAISTCSALTARAWLRRPFRRLNAHSPFSADLGQRCQSTQLLACQLIPVPRKTPAKQQAPLKPLPAAPLPAPPPPAAPAPRDRQLRDLLPDDAKGLAVVQLITSREQTPSPEIIEIAVIRFDRNGAWLDEWSSLVNPPSGVKGDQGHSMTKSMLDRSPGFHAIASCLAGRLDGFVLAGAHWMLSGAPILQRHFQDHAGLPITLGDGIDLSPATDKTDVMTSTQHREGALAEVRIRAESAMQNLQDLQCATQICTQLAGAGRLSSGSAGYPRQKALAELASTRESPPLDTTNVVRSGRWRKTQLLLQTEQRFLATQNRRGGGKLPIVQQAEDHLLGLGLSMTPKSQRIKVSDPPDFVVTPDLKVGSTKMQDAKRLHLPIVICKTACQATLGSLVEAWVHEDE